MGVEVSGSEVDVRVLVGAGVAVGGRGEAGERVAVCNDTGVGEQETRRVRREINPNLDKVADLVKVESRVESILDSYGIGAGGGGGGGGV